MKKLFAAFLFSAVLLTPASLYAAAGPLDIHEALILTLQNNSSLLSLRQELAKAEAFRIAADGTKLPAVTLNLNADKQKEPQTSDGSDRDDSRSLKGTIEQVVYSGGKNSALRSQSPRVKSIAELAVANSENLAAGELFGRFYNVLLQGERIKAEEAAVKRSELHLREVRKMNELGLANRLEVIRAAQILASNTADLSSAKGKFEAAHIALMNYIAIPPEERRPIFGDLTIGALQGNRAESLRLAAEFRADLKSLKEQLLFQQNQISIEKSGALPKVILGAYGTWSSPYGNKDRTDDNWRAELSISVPVFDRNVSRSNVIRAKASLEQDKIAVGQKEIDIKSEVETAWTEAETTLLRLKATTKALELAKESLRLAEVGYKEGVSPQLDLLDAQSKLTSAMLENDSAKYNHLIAAAALKMAEGTIIKWSGEIK